MIQIRQKKQEQRTQIRREFLENHFRAIRNKLIIQEQSNSQIRNYENQTDLQILEKIINSTLIYNFSVQQIRQRNFLNTLRTLIQRACTGNNNTYKKYLLTIISNCLKDELQIYQKQQLFSISLVLFRSLNISEVNFNNREEECRFKQTIKDLHIEVITYYISQIMFLDKNLEQKDQQQVEKILYPALSNVLFYAIHNQDIIQANSQFSPDIQRCIVNIFDPSEQPYEAFSFQKLKRNFFFFNNLLLSHVEVIRRKQFFPQKFARIQSILFWLYNRLTHYQRDIPEFFQSKLMYELVQKGFQNNQNSNKLKELYSIVRTFVDNNVFLQQINGLMSKSVLKKSRLIFQILLQKIVNDEDSKKQYSAGYYALELLQGFVVSYSDGDSFKLLVQKFKFRIVQICIKILYDTDVQVDASVQNMKLLKMAITIIHQLFLKEDTKISKNINEIVIHFQSMKGANRLFQINQWLQEVDRAESKDAQDIYDLIGQISILNFEFNDQEKWLIQSQHKSQTNDRKKLSNRKNNKIALILLFFFHFLQFLTKFFQQSLNLTTQLHEIYKDQSDLKYKQMFFIIHDDKPIYQFYFNQGDRPIKQLFLVHSALDTVDFALTKKKDYYIGSLKNQQLSMFAFVNPNQLRLILVLNLQNKKQIDKKTDTQIRDFFTKANEQLASAMLNPLYKIKEPIKSKNFDQKVRGLARDYLKSVLMQKKK